jgi:hypothetical protein
MIQSPTFFDFALRAFLNDEAGPEAISARSGAQPGSERVGMFLMRVLKISSFFRV